jgi:hypothetical protein
MRCDVLQRPLYGLWDGGWRGQVGPLGLEAVLVCHIRQPDLLALGRSVGRGALRNLGLRLGVPRVLQEPALFS